MRVSLDQLRELVHLGKRLSLVKDLYGEGVILITKGKVLSVEDLKRIANKIIGSTIEVQDAEDSFISPEIKKALLKEIKTILYEHSYYKNMNASKRKQTSKIIDNIYPHSDYVSFALMHIKKFSNSLFLHSINVAILSLIVDMAWQKRHNNGLIDSIRLEHIFFGAILHDLGYLSSTKELTNVKRKDKNFEKDITFREHPFNGYIILKRDSAKHKFDVEILKIVLSHEERIDGSGFPAKLSNNQLDIQSRIVILCNEFEHLLSGGLTDYVRSFTDISRYLMARVSLFDKSCVNVAIEEFRYLE